MSWVSRTNQIALLTILALQEVSGSHGWWEVGPCPAVGGAAAKGIGGCKKDMVAAAVGAVGVRVAPTIGSRGRRFMMLLLYNVNEIWN